MKTKFITAQKEKLLRGQIDRRQFISAAVAAGVALPSAVSISDAVLAATPKKGGRLRQGFSAGSTTESLDALKSTGAVVEICNNWCWGSNLTELTPDGSVVPELAESIESSADAKTWIIKLRKGVEFHNGKALSQDDVIDSVNRHRGKDTASASKALFTQVKDIRKDGTDNVVMELEAGNADFPFVLGDYRVVIMASDGEGNVDIMSGNGTGPYAVADYKPGVRAFFKRNPNYFKPDRAHFDEIEHLVLVDPTARQNALRTGDVDIIDAIDPKTAHLMAKAPGIRVQEVTGTQSRNMTMRLDTPPFDNADLRLALKWAAKRQEMVDKIESGHGAIGNDHPISPTQQFFNAELPQREYDADKAKFHLKKSGMEGATVELVASPAALDGATNAALLLKESAASIGLTVNVKRVPSDGFWSDVWNKPGNGFTTSYWGGRPTNDWMFATCCVADSNWNDMAWKGTEAADKFNKLVVQARSELDVAKRKDLYWECQRLLWEDGGYIIWGFTNYLHGLRDNVRHPDEIAGNWTLDGCKNAERWWFA
ncbi:MAG: ABC transporter substrate-binding protein [Hyphomicrobiales bacterium]|nr:ABC transporter substrate-binding protein [Hyphomicrobiales bacterium]